MNTLVSLDTQYKEVLMTTKGYKKIKNEIGAHWFKVIGPFIILKDNTCERPEYSFKKAQNIYSIEEIAKIIVSKGFELDDVIRKDYFVEYCDSYSDWHKPEESKVTFKNKLSQLIKRA